MIWESKQSIWITSETFHGDTV